MLTGHLPSSYPRYELASFEASHGNATRAGEVFRRGVEALMPASTVLLYAAADFHEQQGDVKVLINTTTAVPAHSSANPL